MSHEEFNEIRSFRDNEVEDAVARIAANEQFQRIVAYLFGKENTPAFLQKFQQMRTINEFQGNIILAFFARAWYSYFAIGNTNIKNGIPEVTNGIRKLEV